MLDNAIVMDGQVYVFETAVDSDHVCRDCALVDRCRFVRGFLCLAFPGVVDVGYTQHFKRSPARLEDETLNLIKSVLCSKEKS